MSGVSRSGHLPYVIMGAMRTGHADDPTWTVGRRAKLATALKYVHDATYAWMRLVGHQAPVLIWWVRDARDGTDHYLPGDQPRGQRNDNQSKESTTLF